MLLRMGARRIVHVSVRVSERIPVASRGDFDCRGIETCFWDAHRRDEIGLPGSMVMRSPEMCVMKRTRHCRVRGGGAVPGESFLRETRSYLVGRWTTFACWKLQNQGTFYP